MWNQDKTPTANEEAAFCDVEEMRTFTQEELDWRAANAPWNLRKDFKTNQTFERECAGEIENAYTTTIRRNSSTV